MKTILYISAICFSISVSAQDNRPKSIFTAPITGTENITGNAATTIQPPLNPDVTHTTATNATRVSTAQPVSTQYGRNNDGSSSGTTVTGSGGSNSTITIEEATPNPGNKAGTWIMTPRK